MATISWVVMKHHKKTDGTYNPKIRVTHGPTTAYMATPIYTEMVRFKKGASSGTVTDGDIKDSLNERVKVMRAILNNNSNVVELCATAKDVLELIRRKMEYQNQEIDFFEFADKIIPKIKKPGSREVRTTGMTVLSWFLGERKLPIRKLTAAFLRRYEAWLRSDNYYEIDGVRRMHKAIQVTTLINYMATVQFVFNKACEEYNDYEVGDMVIRHDPFRGYKIPLRPVTTKKAIDPEVIRKIMAYQPLKKHRREWLARDTFLLSFMLAGMNTADLYSCVEYNNGRIGYCRQKTRDHKRDGGYISIPVVPELQPLFEKYRDPSGLRVFNFYQEHDTSDALILAIHRGLRSMCKSLELPNMTFYAARHSFATIARNDCDVSMDDIALCLTHSSGYDITDVYVKKDFSRVDKVIRKVVDHVFGEDPKESTGNRPIMRVVGGKMVDKDEGVA